MAKYNAKLLTQTTVYIDNNTGDVCNPSETERLLDAINGTNKFTFCVLYSCIGDVSENNYNQLNEAAYNLAESNGIYDFELYIKK